MLVPVFLGLAAAINRPSVSRAPALLFASTILLSACASMIGAGAHLVAADFVSRLTGKPMDFAYWALLGAPFGLLTSLLACGLIQLLFLSADDRRAPVAPGWRPQSALARNQGLIIAVIALTIVLWATSSLHGVDMAVIALIAALVVGSRLVSGIALKDALKAVEWNLLLFLAATLVMGEALLSTGAADFVAAGMVDLFATFGAPAPGWWCCSRQVSRPPRICWLSPAPPAPVC
ncbi:anion permease [Devosia sp. A8/3-2]|nr:anion permease [Devosia sp. A8/3-2]